MWVYYLRVDVWADCLRYFHIDINELPGADGIMLAERIRDHVDYLDVGEERIQRGSVAAAVRAYEPEVEVTTITEFNSPELAGLADVEEVDV